MNRKRLNDSEVQSKLLSLPGWTLEAGSLQQKFRFQNFVEAFGFMTQVALIAEKMDHHPDLRNVYRDVEIKLSTHDAGGITELDLTLAGHINQIATKSR